MDGTVAEVEAGRDEADETGKSQAEERDEAQTHFRQQIFNADGAYGEQVLRLTGQGKILIDVDPPHRLNGWNL